MTVRAFAQLRWLTLGLLTIAITVIAFTSTPAAHAVGTNQYGCVQHNANDGSCTNVGGQKIWVCTVGSAGGTVISYSPCTSSGGTGGSTPSPSPDPIFTTAQTVRDGTGSFTFTPACSGSTPGIKLTYEFSNAIDSSRGISITRAKSSKTSPFLGIISSHTANSFHDLPVEVGVAYVYRMEFRQSNRTYLIQSPLIQAPSSCPIAAPTPTPQGTLPKRPGLGAIAQCSAGVPRVTLGWDTPEKGVLYTLKRNGVVLRQIKVPVPGGPVSTGLQAFGAGTKASYIDTAIQANTTYEYLVEASGSTGTVTSAVQSITVPACPEIPSAPVLTGASTCADSKVVTTLSWKASQNAEWYRILRKPSKVDLPLNDRFVIVANVLASTAIDGELRYTFPKAEDQAASWKVVALNNAGEAESSPITVPFASATCAGSPTPTTPTYALTGQYSHTITGLPADHRWGTLAIQGLTLRGGSITLKFAGDQSNYSQFSPSYQLSETSTQIDLASVPQLANSQSLQAIFTLTAGQNGQSTPSLAGFSTTAVAIPPATNPTPPASGPQVRFLYLTPKGTSHTNAYTSAITAAATNLKSWFATKLEGKTFTLSEPIVETLALPHNADWYGQQPSFWNAINADVFALTGGTYNDPENIWIEYVDIDTPCGQVTGATHHVALLPQDDIRGLVGETPIRNCPNEGDQPQHDKTVDRWIGGLGHELGHAVGLPHPSGCEDSNAATACDTTLLMWTGYLTYPDATLSADDRTALLDNTFFGGTAPLTQGVVDQATAEQRIKDQSKADTAATTASTAVSSPTAEPTAPSTTSPSTATEPTSSVTTPTTPAAISQGLSDLTPRGSTNNDDTTTSTDSTKTTTDGSGAKLGAPTALSGKAQSRTSIALTWNDTAEGERNYVVERRLTTCKIKRIRIVRWRFKTERVCPEFSPVATLNANATSHTDSKLRRNTLYEYRVKATSETGESHVSNAARVRTRR